MLKETPKPEMNISDKGEIKQYTVSVPPGAVLGSTVLENCFAELFLTLIPQIRSSLPMPDQLGQFAKYCIRNPELIGLNPA